MAGINIAYITVSIIVILISLTFHEMAHAAAANALGDPTAKNLGRISANPLDHIHWFGTIALPLLLAWTGAGVFGYAKPVPVNLHNLSNPRRDDALISAAGPAANLALAIISSLALRIILFFPEAGSDLLIFIVFVLRMMIVINIYLMLFNMLPIAPLDGSGVLQAFLPPRAWLVYQENRQVMMMVFLGLILFTDFFHIFYLSPVSKVFLYPLQFVAGVPLV